MLPLEDVLAIVFADKDAYLSKNSNSRDEDVCGHFEDDEGCLGEFISQNRKKISQPDACDRPNFLEIEEDIM